MKNVLIFTEVAFEISETFIQNQFKHQHKHNIIGLCNKKKDVDSNFENKFIQIPYMPINFTDRILSKIHKTFNNLYRHSFSFFTEKKIIGILKKEKIDIIHCNYGPNALKFINVIKKTKIPLIVHFHGYDASKSLEDSYYSSLLPSLFELSKKIIVVSDDMKQRITPFLKTKNLHKLEIISYGIDLKKIENTKEVRTEKDLIRILHVGRLTPKKGVYELIEVFNEIIKTRLYNVKLDIIGNGEEFEKLRDLISVNNLNNNVVLHGSLSHSDVIRFMKKSDIFVLNSQVAPDGDKEGFPNVIIEAMACELAIISTNHAGIPMAITNEKEGLLIEEKNKKELKTAIIKLITNVEKRKDYAYNAKVRAFNNFSVEKMIAKYNLIYNSI